ncbi:putative L-ascorbate peroxidase 6 [Vitis vinifera]|uniref:Putative L-ascorbate peroxidase 6 n=1 Tax=Vitis vinifera TaxID=29760 RepID=A0A438KF19_VITVI|nr:putative L-ascorbate peroxidase 6 [Vitis vinifera]
MASYGFDHSLLCPLSPFSCSGKVKFPAKTPLSTVEFCAKASKSSSVATTAIEDSNQPCFGVSYGRRELIVIATLPFLLPVHESMQKFGVKAAELGTTEYLLMKEEVRKVLSKGKAAGVLRLVFHDAGTFEMDDNSGGMNGSIVYELDRPENIVSWADMIAVAGAEAVSVCGGPKIPVQLGRLDSMAPDPEGKLPEESLDASALKQCFQRKGLAIASLSRYGPGSNPCHFSKHEGGS